MSLRRIQRELVDLLAMRGRGDLASDALDKVAYTDDGSSLYVHILPKPSWPKRRPGQAFPLAFAGHDQLTSLSQHRDLLREAHLLLQDEIDDIINWLDGRS